MLVAGCRVSLDLADDQLQRGAQLLVPEHVRRLETKEDLLDDDQRGTRSRNSSQIFDSDPGNLIHIHLMLKKKNLGLWGVLTIEPSLYLLNLFRLRHLC